MIYFLIYLFLEIFVSVEISAAIGPFWTFIEVIVSALAGLLLLTNFRYTFSENMRAMMAGEITPESFQKQNLAALVGAILLIVPGFFTDIVGLLLQFGIFSGFIARRFFGKSRPVRGPEMESENEFKKGECDVIDVEIVDHPDHRK
ncbi:FxsA family protein [Hydrogenimonas sp.]